MKKTHKILLILLGLIVVGYLIFSQFLTGGSQQKFLNARLGDSPNLKLEIAHQSADMTQGLSGRDELDVDGMLFVFNSDRLPQFWMKEMKFDLDLIWIKDNQVVEVVSQVPAPAPGQADTTLPLYQPSQLVDMVLEVQAGKAVEWGVEPGVRLEWSDSVQYFPPSAWPAPT